MAIRNIIKELDPTLRKKSRLVENFDQKLFDLLGDLTDTMKKADGVGLAAPQVAVLRRVVVIDVGEGVIEMVNPVITNKSSQCEEEAEGCLSSPGEYGIVARPVEVTVQYCNRNGKKCSITGEGLLARAICHEVDHLDGILFKDLASEMLEPEDLE